MSYKKLYFQKEQAQLDCWKADLIKLNSKALLASAEIQLEMNKHIRSIGYMLNECEVMLKSSNMANKKPFDSSDIGMESALSTLKYSVIDATAKFK
jgi:hypothetical protein